MSPMEETSTQKTKAEKLIEYALKTESFPQATKATIEFIKNFAANFRVQKEINGRIQEFILN